MCMYVCIDLYVCLSMLVCVSIRRYRWICASIHVLIMHMRMSFVKVNFLLYNKLNELNIFFILCFCKYAFVIYYVPILCSLIRCNNFLKKERKKSLNFNNSDKFKFKF